jgi:hypothetical protein
MKIGVWESDNDVRGYYHTTATRVNGGTVCLTSRIKKFPACRTTPPLPNNISVLVLRWLRQQQRSLRCTTTRRAILYYCVPNWVGSDGGVWWSEGTMPCPFHTRASCSRSRRHRLACWPLSPRGSTRRCQYDHSVLPWWTRRGHFFRRTTLVENREIAPVHNPY